MCVEIEHANIVSEHSYAALSYVWGDDQSDLHPVIIDGKSVHFATYNLWQALRRIRVEYEDRVLWVDVRVAISKRVCGCDRYSSHSSI